MSLTNGVNNKIIKKIIILNNCNVRKNSEINVFIHLINIYTLFYIKIVYTLLYHVGQQNQVRKYF